MQIIKWLGIIAASLVGAFMLGTVVFAISESMSDTETLASRSGMSISQCRDITMKFGASYSEADRVCSERFPKK
jgi:hypothetical protein